MTSSLTSNEVKPWPARNRADSCTSEERENVQSVLELCVLATFDLQNADQKEAVYDMAMANLLAREQRTRCRKRQVRFNEIATVHVYHANLSPTIPSLFQPALQKTVFSWLSGGNRAATTLGIEKLDVIGVEEQRVDRSMLKKSTTAQKKCTSTAA